MNAAESDWNFVGLEFQFYKSNDECINNFAIWSYFFGIFLFSIFNKIFGFKLQLQQMLY